VSHDHRWEIQTVTRAHASGIRQSRREVFRALASVCKARLLLDALEKLDGKVVVDAQSGRHFDCSFGFTESLETTATEYADYGLAGEVNFSGQLIGQLRRA